MFTGMIDVLGKIIAIKDTSEGVKFSIAPVSTLNNISIGSSIAVNGACLTATKIQNENGYFDADISSETLKRTVLKQAKIGELVNLERAIRFSDRLDGHLVSGHVDGVSMITGEKKIGNTTIMVFSIPVSLSKYVIAKGSVAVDGISLTVNSCNEKSFSVSVIPHTLKITTLGIKKTGSLVNLETDIIGRYVEQFVKKNQNLTKINRAAYNGIDIAFLKSNGFF